MTTFVESLKRLYLAGKISKEKIESLFSENKISLEDKNYIIGI